MLVEDAVGPLLNLQRLFRFLLDELTYFHLNVLLVLFADGGVHRPVLVEHLLRSLLEIPGGGFGDAPLVLSRLQLPVVGSKPIFILVLGGLGKQVIVLRPAAVPIFVLAVALLLQRLHLPILLLLPGQPRRSHILALPLLYYLVSALVFQQILEVPKTAVHAEVAGGFKVLLRTSIAVFASQLQTWGGLTVTLLGNARVVLGSRQRGDFLMLVEVVGGIEGEALLEFVELFGLELRLHGLHILPEPNLQGLRL